MDRWYLQICNLERLINFIFSTKKNMMRPSQNFLLDNGTIFKLNEWINNLKKICQFPPPFEDTFKIFK